MASRSWPGKRSSCFAAVFARSTVQVAGSFILIEGDGLAGEKFSAGAFEGARFGRSRGNEGEGGGAGEVVAQRFADKLGAGAVLGFAGALNLFGHRYGQ